MRADAPPTWPLRPHDAAERAGALAALAALRHMAATAERPGNEVAESFDRWLKTRSRALGAVIEAAGTVDPRTAGFVATLAEYALYAIESGPPTLTSWHPEACMTPLELGAARERHAADLHEGDPPIVR